MIILWQFIEIRVGYNFICDKFDPYFKEGANQKTYNMQTLLVFKEAYKRKLSNVKGIEAVTVKTFTWTYLTLIALGLGTFAYNAIVSLF